jgi:hypothetical protein
LMSEDSLKSPEERAGKPDDDLSDEQRWGRRASAILLVCNVFLSALVVFATRSHGQVIGWIVALVVARSLYRLQPGADTITIVLACMAGIIGPILYFINSPVQVALIQSIATWGVVAALLMLLIGQPSRLRRVGALGAYGTLTVSVDALAIVGSMFVK